MCLQRNMAALESSNYALCFNTGMSATITALSLLKQGDHFICIDDVYGGTQRYIREVFTPATNIEWDMIDMNDISLIKKTIRPNTKMMWIESPTNPTLKCTDVAAVAKICKPKGILLCIDNTFMSPVLQNPLKLGADIVMHSMTKYIGGHGDVVAGSLCFNDGDLYDKLFFNMKSMGGIIAPFDAWVCLRGTKTLEVRMSRVCENAMKIAKHLESHKKIDKVLYPGLPSHPHYKIALANRADKKMSGGSGMVSMYIKGDIKKAGKFMSSLKVVTLAESLGEIKTLVESPAIMTHASVPREHRKMLGIDDNFIRMSIGIENVEDLIADIDQALAKI